MKKWPIPSGVNLSVGGIIAFDEITGFHSPITNGFGLDKAGEQVLLSYANGGGNASVVDSIKFKAQENGRSVGRYPDASGFWRECSPTPGSSNVLAAQLPVISEIMYHPLELVPGTENRTNEYVEIFNPTSQPVNLWSMDNSTNVGSWRLDGQADYVFPANTILAAYDRVLLVSFDPVTNATARYVFTNTYGIPSSVKLFGPFSGELSNQGGRVALEKPLAPDVAGESVSWVIVDEVYYSDGFPWPASADGGGYSLHRTTIGASGVDVSAWTSASSTPGVLEVVNEELMLSITNSAGQLKLGFTLLPGFNYTIELRTNLAAGVWTSYATVTNPATEHVISLPAQTSPAFFRLRRN